MSLEGLRLALGFRRSARFVRMICVLSLAFASVFHIVNDFHANGSISNQIAISSADDDRGGDSSQTAEVCHGCSVAPYLSILSSPYVPAASFEVPEGRLIQVSPASSRMVGPPPRG